MVTPFGTINFVKAKEKQIAMQTYSGKWTSRLSMLLPGLVGAAWVYSMIVRFVHDFHSHLGFSFAPVFVWIPNGLIGLLFCWFSLYTIAHSLSIYRLDNENIEKRLFGRTVSLSWRSLAAVECQGKRASRISLTDSFGQ